MWRIELITASEIEVLGWCPDADSARLIAEHYRRVCPEGVVRVRRATPR